MTSLMLDQVRSRSAGWLASARQKLFTKSDLRVERMSSKTAFMRASAETSSSVQSFTVAIVKPLKSDATMSWYSACLQDNGACTHRSTDRSLGQEVAKVLNCPRYTGGLGEAARSLSF